MYKGIRKKKMENLHDVKLIQTRCQNLSMLKPTVVVGQSYFSISKPIAYNKLVMEMGDMS